MCGCEDMDLQVQSQAHGTEWGPSMPFSLSRFSGLERIKRNNARSAQDEERNRAMLSMRELPPLFLSWPHWVLGTSWSVSTKQVPLSTTAEDSTP